MSLLGRAATDPIGAVVASPSSPAALRAALGRRGVGGRPVRPVRALVGALLVVTAVVAALAVYTRISDRVEVLAAGRTVLAGERLSASDLRVVSVAREDGLVVVPATERDELAGQYARVRLVAGTLLVPDGVQPEPLATAGRVLMSVEVAAGEVPVGLRERSRVVLIVESPEASLARNRSNSAPTNMVVEATIAHVPANLADVAGVADGSTSVSLSIEVDPQYVVAVGAAERIGIGVLDPLDPLDLAGSADVSGAVDDGSPAVTGTGS
jgi:hypothetical protein